MNWKKKTPKGSMGTPVCGCCTVIIKGVGAGNQETSKGRPFRPGKSREMFLASIPERGRMLFFFWDAWKNKKEGLGESPGL